MSIDWTKPICTTHETPFIAMYLGRCPVHSSRRRAMFVCPSTVAMGPQNFKPGTFRYDDEGRTRGDGAPSENDLINYDPSDGVRRIGLPKER